MTKIVVTNNFQRIKAFLSGVDKKAIQQAVARSIKRTVPAVQKAGASEFRAKKLLKLNAAQWKYRIRGYVEAKASQDVASQRGKVWVTPRPEPLAHFYARRIRAGRSPLTNVQLYRVQLNSEGMSALPGNRAFLINQGQGQVVLARVGGAKRLPVQKLYGASPADLATRNGVVARMVDVAETRYATEFTSNLKYYVDNALKRAVASGK